MTGLQVFQNAEFGSIRTVMIDGEPWFVGLDVAKRLGYSNSRDAISKHVDTEDKGVAKCDTLGGHQNLSVINESGVYSLCFASKLPGAKKFKRWVTSEVLPSIRKTGSYEIPYRQAQAALETARPMIDFARAVCASESSVMVADVAKMLWQNGIRVGANRLLAELRERGLLIRRKGPDYNRPTQKGMERGLFELKETTFTYANGRTVTFLTTMITGKGQLYIYNLFARKKLEAGEALCRKSKN